MSSSLDINTLLQSAIDQHSSGNIDDARKLYEEVLRQSPDNYDAINLIAVIEYQKGNYQNAIERYRRAIDINPGSAEILTNYAAALKANGDTEEAMGALRQAIAINDSFTLAHFNLANLLLDIDKDQAFVEYRIVIKQDPDNVEAHKITGWLLHTMDRQQEALDSLNKVIDGSSQDSETYHVIGSVYRAMGRDAEAIHAYEKSLSINPDNVAATHLLQALRGDSADIAPPEYVRDLFDDFATDFDSKLVDKLQYKTPTLMRTIFDEVNEKTSYAACLDLGCGTGLSGIAFKDITTSITGIDLSEGMVDKARQKAIYDSLIVSDLSEYLTGTDAVYDLVLSADVFVYIGKLNSLFSEVSSHMCEGGYFIFSIELLESGDYRLKKSGRYGHSHDYIKSIAIDSEFDIVAHKDMNLRKESGNWIQGSVFVLRKL